MRRQHSITILGKTNWRGQGRPFGIQQRDRLSHLHVIGRTGVGKSHLLRSIAEQDIHAGRGVAVFDPHGDLAEALVASLSDTERERLIYFDAPSTGMRYRFNPLAGIAPQHRPLAAAQILDVFKSIWADSWGPRLEHLLRNVLLTLVDQPEPTFADALKLIHDEKYRKRAVDRVANAQVRRFWLEEWESYGSRLRAESASPLQNKLGAFVTAPVLQRTVLEPGTQLNLREVMDQGRILIVNLSKGLLGEDVAALLGSLLLSSLGLAALSRAAVPELQRRDFFVIADEFQLFITQTLAGMLSELRKFHVGLTLAHQFLGQLDEELQQSILGNVGSLICFRVGLTDAELLEREFAPTFSAEDLGALPNREFYVRLLVDGVPTKGFSGVTVLSMHKRSARVPVTGTPEQCEYRHRVPRCNSD